MEENNIKEMETNIEKKYMEPLAYFRFVSEIAVDYINEGVRAAGFEDYDFAQEGYFGKQETAKERSRLRKEIGFPRAALLLFDRTMKLNASVPGPCRVIATLEGIRDGAANHPCLKDVGLGDIPEGRNCEFYKAFRSVYGKVEDMESKIWRTEFGYEGQVGPYHFQRLLKDETPGGEAAAPTESKKEDNEMAEGIKGAKVQEGNTKPEGEKAETGGSEKDGATDAAEMITSKMSRAEFEEKMRRWYAAYNGTWGHPHDGTTYEDWCAELDQFPGFAVEIDGEKYDIYDYAHALAECRMYSEAFAAHVNKKAAEDGKKGYRYEKLSEEEAEVGCNKYAMSASVELGYYLRPSWLFCNMYSQPHDWDESWRYYHLWFDVAARNLEEMLCTPCATFPLNPKRKTTKRWVPVPARNDFKNEDDEALFYKGILPWLIRNFIGKTESSVFFCEKDSLYQCICWGWETDIDVTRPELQDVEVDNPAA